MASLEKDEPKAEETPTLTAADATGSYLWEIENTEQIAEFLEAENRKRFKSNPFSIGKLQWLLEAFPNGDREINIGSFMVYLTLIALPNSWQRVTFLLRLFNAETASSFTGIASYTKTSNSGGWSDGTLLLNDLKSSIKECETNKISLGVKINILQLIGTKNEKIYEYPLKAQYINIVKSSNPMFDIKWEISPALLQKFRKANVGKKFESDIFYDLWSLRCAPNGKRDNDKNNVKLYLLLCALPPNIVHCKVKYTLSCDEANVQWTNTREFSYKYPNVGWPNGTMLTQHLQTKYKHLKTLTFRAKIQILKLSDHDVISDGDDDDDDDDDDVSTSSSYDSPDDDDPSENEDLGDIKMDILHNNKTSKTQRRKSLAKKSEVKRRQSTELMLPIPVANIKAHFRQETDVIPLRKTQVQSPSTPGLLMKATNTNGNYNDIDIDIGNGGNDINIDMDMDRSRSSTMVEVKEEGKEKESDAYNERLLNLENNFKSLSLKLNRISETVKNLSLNLNLNLNDDKRNVYNVLNAIKVDIALIKNKLIPDDDLNEKQEKMKDWLSLNVGLPQYFHILIENGLEDLEIVKDLNENELMVIGITKLGHRKKILKCIEVLRMN